MIGPVCAEQARSERNSLIAEYAFEKLLNRFEIPLGQGIRFERRLFHGLFGTEDQKEGMAAFVDKRPGNWKGK